ncbi:ketoacyl_synth_N domain-containing protein [Trichonephila clavipes]|nr:ketoacyl_synth_N domain-containing protein [Trichonephila clavipes]
MAPTLDCHEYCTGGFDPDDIVISGIAGRFPECDNVGELKESLYNKKDLVVFRDDRFEKDNMLTKYQMIKFIDFCEVWFLPESVARVAAIVRDHRCNTPRH